MAIRTPVETQKSEDMLEPFFRTVTVDDKRKGLRLERVFWQVLEQLSKEENTPVSAILQAAESNGNSSPNLSSYARAYAANWLRRRLDANREIASFQQVLRTINACPSPVFVTSEDRRLRAYNPAFLRYVRRHIPMEDLEAAPKNLRLQMDTGSAELIQQLKSEPEAIVTVGFTFGFNERRVRGRLNAVLASCWSEDLVTAYVLE